MTATAKSSTKKAPKPTPVSKVKRGSIVLPGKILTGQALLDDMETYRQTVSASPDAARSFLKRLGVMTPSGRLKRLIRD